MMAKHHKPSSEVYKAIQLLLAVFPNAKVNGFGFNEKTDDVMLIYTEEQPSDENPTV